MQSSDRIDAALRQAVASGDVPGVVAMAASGEGVVCAGAFVVRDLAAGTAMTGDTVFRIASMTKMVTAIGALQLVEQGRLALDAPVPDIDPTLSAPRVLEGFDAAGAPRLRPARRPITLRPLPTPPPRFSYEGGGANTRRYFAGRGMPPARTRTLPALRL